MTYPKTGGGELAFPQDNADAVLNGSIRRLDALSARAIIVDRDLTAPPGSCADGDNYLVATGGTGAWASQDGKLATAVGTNASNGWTFQTVAVDRYRIGVQDENVEIEYQASAWVNLIDPAALTIPTEASAAEIRTGTETGKFLSPDKIYDASVAADLTSGATITPNGSDGYNFTLTLATNATLANPTNFKEGQSGLIKITQDGTGSRTLAYGSNWKFPGGPPVLSTAAGGIDLLAYHVWASGEILATLSKDYST
jgi:Protein of unknown function (DUF2793)